MYKRFILVGKAASGKDYAKKLLTEIGFKRAISSTTRPMRDGEQDGVDYYFLSEKEYQADLDDGKFLESQNFRGWFYGTHLDALDYGQVFIMTPGGVRDVPKSILDESYLILFDVDEGIRLERLEARGDVDDVERRMRADNEDFADFTFCNKLVTNPLFTLDELLEDLTSSDGLHYTNISIPRGDINVEKYDQPVDLHQVAQRKSQWSPDGNLKGLQSNTNEILNNSKP